MNGKVPESIGQLVLLEELWLGDDMNSNAFAGPLPSSMSNLILLHTLYLNVATLSGPMPDFSRLTRLTDCGFAPSQMCIIPGFVPVNRTCDFSVLPDCDMIVADCVIITDWLPRMFDSYTCCLVDGVTCEDERIVVLDLSSSATGKHISGNIPLSIGGLDEIQQLYLQDNFLEGNLPLSMSNLSSLKIVDISNNFLSGLIPFDPSFELIGIESNLDLSLPVDLVDLPSSIETATETLGLSQYKPNDSSGILPLIIGISAGVLVIIFLAVAILILLIRRKQGKETEIELRLLPKYSSPNKQIRLMKKINSGGFGVVWKARYKGQTVAIKLILMDKFKDKNNDNMRYFNTVKMVVEEASIMELMVHERIVRYITFEIKSIGIVLEYLPLGSLYDYLQKCKEVMPWTDRYQMMLDICEGMEFLHSNVYASGKMKKVLFHQDLKSGNILLCMEGSPLTLRGKISDFGLSCMFLF
jgi:LRR receptor-like serine/threonine-protein kinase FLS2